MPSSSVAQSASTLFQDVLPIAIVLLAIVVAGGIVIMIARKRTRSGADGSAGGFTLHDLRQLHAAGELSDEQFEKAKASLIGRLAPPPETGDAEADEDDGAGGPANGGDDR